MIARLIAWLMGTKLSTAETMQMMVVYSNLI